MLYETITTQNQRELNVTDAASEIGLEVGMPISVSPDVNGGEQPVTGTVRFADADTIVIDRHTDEVGNVCVHFPRAGYRVDVL